MARGLILAARHPRPRIAGRICYGRTDVPLAETPEAGAAALMSALDDAEIGRIVASPLSRALLVAQAVARQTGAPLHTDDRLQEMDFGEWENQAWTSLPRPEIDAWAADPLRYRPGPSLKRSRWGSPTAPSPGSGTEPPPPRHGGSPAHRRSAMCPRRRVSRDTTRCRRA
jgi:broad specificity phosphatase PhoE